MQENCYLLIEDGAKQAIVIDPGDDSEYITDTLVRLAVQPTAIIATHGHFDHVMAAFALQHTFSVPFYANPKDQFLLDHMEESAKHFLGVPHTDPSPAITHELHQGTIVHLGDTTLLAFETGGHTPGSLSLVTHDRKMVFVGDLIFRDGGVGRTDFSYSDKKTLRESVHKILAFPDETILYPGHGMPTTVGEEKMYHRAT